MCENSIDGIILSNMSRRYQVQSQAVDSSYNHRFYFVTQKLLEISDNGITFK